MHIKGFGEELPVVDYEYLVSAKGIEGSENTLISIPMRCYFSVALFPLKSWGGNRRRLAPRAWMVDKYDKYWGWGSKSYAWPLDADEWEYQLILARGIPQGPDAMRFAKLVNLANDLRNKLADVEWLMEQAEIDDLR